MSLSVSSWLTSVKVKETFPRDLSRWTSPATNASLFVHDKIIDLETRHNEIRKDERRHRLCSPVLAAHFERLPLHFATVVIEQGKMDTKLLGTALARPERDTEGGHLVSGVLFVFAQCVRVLDFVG